MLGHTPSSPHLVELYTPDLAHLGTVVPMLKGLPAAGQLPARVRQLLITAAAQQA